MKRTLFFVAIVVCSMMLSCNEKEPEVVDNGVFVSGEIDGYDYVDLGPPSGIKWATCNVGADSFEDYGDYYAWGEVETKAEYTTDNSVTWGVIIGNISGNVKYDVARNKWGGTWRLPSKEELIELAEECKWEVVTQNGVKGYKVTGPNSNKLFLPFAGYRYGENLYNEENFGYLWCSNPYENNKDYSYSIEFNNNERKVLWDNRYDGQSVRPVTK